MKKEVKDELFKEKGVVNIPLHKKIWMSMTKFEKYPEMAAEGVGKALKYLAFLIFIFALIFGICLTFQIITTANDMVDYIEENFDSIDYSDGTLNLELNNDENVIITDMGTVIIDTSDITSEQLETYENTLEASDLGIIWLKESVEIKISGENQNMSYEELFDLIGLTEFDKASLLEYIDTNVLNMQTYISYFIMMLIYLFVAYFVSTLLNVLLLSVFGLLTSLIARLKMRYRAVFNMSIYAITLSTVLQLIYMIVTLFTDFEVKYFDIMYSAISYICLVAAIFMIKSDVIKQQIEMMKIVNKEEKQEIEEQQDEKEDKDNEEQKDKKEDKKEEKEKEEELGNEAEGEGSNA